MSVLFMELDNKEGEEGKEDLVIDGGEGSKEDQHFDNVMGLLMEFLTSEAYESKEESFAFDHCDEFEEKDENKLSYTNIHNDWAALVQLGIEKHLSEAIKGFSFTDLVDLLLSREDEVPGDLMELFNTIADFDAFKAMMLSYKTLKKSAASTSTIEVEVHGLTSGKQTSIGGGGLQKMEMPSVNDIMK